MLITLISRGTITFSVANACSTPAANGSAATITASGRSSANSFGIAPIRACKIYFFKNDDFTKRLLPPPLIAPLASATPGGQPSAAPDDRLDAITADLAALSQTVNEIHARVVERPLTFSEAAGETAIDLTAISLELDAIDMDDLPAGATEAESEDWINRYINSGLLEDVIER